MESSPPHLLLGQAGEAIAARFLASKGFTIIERNWRFGHLELDLVCRQEDCLVFVEVKTRRRLNFGGPLGAIGKNKKNRLARAAQAWLLAHKAWEKPCRFDVVCLVKSGNFFRPEHYPNAFDLSQIMDCGYANRQS